MRGTLDEHTPIIKVFISSPAGICHFLKCFNIFLCCADRQHSLEPEKEPPESDIAT